VNVSPQCISTIKHHEGVRLKPYRCPALLWTVGVGHVLYPDQGKLKLNDRKGYALKEADNRVWTQGEVDALLRRDLARFEQGVARMCPASIGGQGRFDALVSFSFNVGLGTLQRSTLRAKFNRGDLNGAAQEFMKFTKAGGKILKGLVNRRNDEVRMYGRSG
jgi:lysozyme